MRLIGIIERRDFEFAVPGDTACVIYLEEELRRHRAEQIFIDSVRIYSAIRATYLRVQLFVEGRCQVYGDGLGTRFTEDKEDEKAGIYEPRLSVPPRVSVSIRVVHALDMTKITPIKLWIKGKFNVLD